MLHEALLNNHQSEAPAKVMVELLSTYTEADAEKAKEDAHKSIRSAIADPGTFVFDHLLSLRYSIFFSKIVVLESIIILIKFSSNENELR